MDGFTYTNLFDTKGIEYLIVIGFLLSIIPFYLLVSRKQKRAEPAVSRQHVITFRSLNIPQGLFFSKYHSWAYLEKNGMAKVGLDDLLLQLTGDVQVSRMLDPGDRIGKGELLTVIRQHEKQLKIYSPVSGRVTATNATLLTNPSLLSSDPYQGGWLYAIEPSDWKADTGSCFLAEDATRWAVRELEHFKDFVTASVARYLADPSLVVLQDGGELVEHPLAELPPEVWADFQTTFLTE